MKIAQRILSMLLVAGFLLATAGCKMLLPTPDAGVEPTPITMDVAEAEPEQGAQQPTPEQAPEATATPDPAAKGAFASLDAEIFRWYATQDGYSFHQLVSNPAAFGIDRGTVEMTLGEFTEESSQIYAREAAAYLERLSQISRASLDENEQLSYDVLEQYLESTVAGAAYEYYYEPLTEYSGLHANLPLMFALFSIESEQDANDYLLLLADVPRYFDQVLAYEQERAKLGMFMTERALEAILKDCKSITDAKDNLFLYATFNEAVDALDTIDKEQAAALKKRNAELIKKDFISAYKSLHDGLKKLKSKCRKSEGVYSQGKTALAYYEHAFQGDANNLLSVEESLELLQDELIYLLTQYSEIFEAHPSILSAEKGPLSTGNTDKDLALVKEVTKTVLPELPKHTLEISDVPEELEDMMSPAAYVIPSLDGWEHNRVLINPSQRGETPLFTLAHETYPGHLYQYVYQRGLTRLGTMQRALHYGAYSEAWSQLGEYLFIQNQTKYDKDYCLVQFYYRSIMNTILPCMVSIWVNYQGYTKDAIELKLEAMFGDQSESLAQSYYELAVDQPYYTVYYAMGQCQLMKMLRDAETDLGDLYNQKEYLTAYLDLGPGYFNIIQERMDVWVDEHVLEALGKETFELTA